MIDFLSRVVWSTFSLRVCGFRSVPSFPGVHRNYVGLRRADDAPRAL